MLNIFTNNDSVYVENNRIYLTEKAVNDYGINLRERINMLGIDSPETVIKSILRQVTRQVYNYIHSFSIHNELQDWTILNIKSAANIVIDALLIQVEYVTQVGNLSFSMDKSHRELILSSELYDQLSITIPEIGRSIIYSGV